MKLKKRIKHLEKRLAAVERRASAIVASLESSGQLSVQTAEQNETDQSNELASELERVRRKVEVLANKLGSGE